MKYNEGGLLERFKDEQYKARFMLVIFAIIVLLMMLFIRINASSYNERKNAQKDNVVGNTDYSTDNNSNENVKESEFNNKFIYLIQNNYEFSYNIVFGDQIYTSVGKRTRDKMLFNFKYNGEETIFFADNNHINANSKDGEKITRFPYFFINYYNIDEILKLINKCEYKEDNKFHISNLDLYRLGDVDVSIENPDADNTVELKEIDGKVVGFKMDFSNLFNNSETNLKEVIFDLNYSNFGFVDDFELPF